MGLTSPATVFIVDDDPDVRAAISLMAKSVGLNVEAYGSADEFLEQFAPEKPGCLILDVRMPGKNGLELQEWLNAQEHAIPTIFITAHGEIPMATRAMRSGAVDFIQKPFSPHALLDRIREAIDLDQQTRQENVQAADASQRLALLSPREREVMDLLAAGHSAKGIAKELGISSKTVDNHRAKILEKTRVDNIAQLVRLVMKHT